jgi:hypothetical protein
MHTFHPIKNDNSLCGAAAAVSGISEMFGIQGVVQFHKFSAQECLRYEMAVDHHWLAELGMSY